MRMWRPKNQTEWWLAFLGATFVAPLGVAIAVSGVAAISSEVAFSAIPLLAPLAGSYLLAITRKPIWFKVAAIPLFFAVVGYLSIPRHSCGDEYLSSSHESNAQVSKNMEHGCNG